MAIRMRFRKSFHSLFMHKQHCIIVLILFISSLSSAYESPKEITLNAILTYPPSFITEESSFHETFEAVYSASFKFALDLIKNKSCTYLPDVLPNTNVVLNELYTFETQSEGIRLMLELGEKGESLVIGLADDAVAVPSATVSTAYDIAILSSNGPSPLLDNRIQYPFYNRMALSVEQQVDALYDQLVMFYEDYGIGWSDIAVISSVDENSIAYSNYFIKIAKEGGILNIASFQQIIPDQEEYSLELDQIADSGARIIVTAIFENIMEVLEQADEKGLVTENHVWTTVSLAQTAMYPSRLLQGILTVQQDFKNFDNPRGVCYEEAYAAADPNVYFGTGGPLPYGFIFDNPMDAIMTAMVAADSLDKQELLDKRVSAADWAEAIRNVKYEGIKGTVSFTPTGSRNVDTEILYGDAQAYFEGRFLFTAFARVSNGEYTKVADIVWFSNTTEIPDLDIREPFSYWSCEDGEEGFDETGKTIVLRSPDGSNPDDIDIDYHCDYFIDCINFSDERFDCNTNYFIVFIVFGIITVLLMLVVLILFVFIVVFGLCLRYQRVRFLSPWFMLILLMSIFVGYSSVFAFFGKPHPVACIFQPWLLGMPVVSMVAVLSAKNYRVYRIFSSPLKRVSVSDFHLFVLWIIVMVPALFIVVLWMIISTPTADFVERDGMDHYVCATGGFTGSPGGFVFFGIFVAYTALLLLIGALISILARNIHPLFNESKLLTLSIYNLGFLAAVIIPVFLVVQPFNPFIAWILRTVAVLYAFTTTMIVQFAPIVYGVAVLDKFKNVQFSLAPKANEVSSSSISGTKSR